MRVDDLSHAELLELPANGGALRFAGQRALLLDAVAMGVLRQYLFENFGATAARAVLTQFGFAHGFRMAQAMRAQYTWDSDEDWRRAGTKVHALQGLFVIDTSSTPTEAEGLTVHASYEAEQHLLHLGATTAPVCWTICGLTSGYLSCSTGQEIFVLEDACEGAGAKACHLVGRTREAWGSERADELRFFEPSRLADTLEVSLQRVITSLKQAESRGRRQTLTPTATPVTRDVPSGLVANSAAMWKVVEVARRVAKVDATVLITGESGSGKERVAKLIHDSSTRAKGPFVAVNCGAVTETLLESELFGHARGAFTGASSDRAGYFESAAGGTLFLDEIGEVSPTMQVKLLRVLQEREVRRVGENRTRAVDVRVVAATNRDLEKAQANGTFRDDLYYRLKVVDVVVPPLRSRKDDILPLARLFLSGTSERMKRPMEGFTPRAADQLVRYAWPGNVRELQNAIERAVALAASDRIGVDDLPEEIRNAAVQPVKVVEATRRLDDVEREYIEAALANNEGNQTKTARELG
ncbi:MAG: sigma-54-dependent Fis family transcriptional regulator, partial [Archangiaceae bacterium]|nr:sigma-54-dependent Fis family transcriptional regulator [Archangiaceae bacterium]